MAAHEINQSTLDAFVAEAQGHTAYIQSCLRQLEQRNARGLHEHGLIIQHATERIQALADAVGKLTGGAAQNTITYTGTVCPVPGCSTRQFQTPSGLTCERGHGGTELGTPVPPVKPRPPYPQIRRPEPMYLIEGATPPPPRRQH